MSELFLGFFNRAMAAGWLILALLLLRPLLKKAPKWVLPLFWGLVGIRLICPFSFTSTISLLPSGEVLSPHTVQYEIPAISSGIQVLDETLNPLLSQSLSPASGDSVNPLYVWTSVLGVVWAMVAAGLLLYALVRYGLLRHRLRTAILVEGRIYESERISSPFVLGFLRPAVYLPAGLAEPIRSCVIAHEKSHLVRKDHWSKALGYLLACAYWFHPLIWVAYVLFCRDLELACDEKVLRSMTAKQRIEYSQSLLSMAANRSRLVCPLAFGETGVKERIKAVLSYKKPALWVCIIVLILGLVLSVCFLTDPISTKDTLRLVSTDGDWITYAVDTEKRITVHVELWQNGACVFQDSSESLSQISQLILHLRRSTGEDGTDRFTFQLDTDTQSAAFLTSFTLEQAPIGWSTTLWNYEDVISLNDYDSVILLARFFDFAYGTGRAYMCQELTKDPSLYQTAPCALIVRVVEPLDVEKGLRLSQP